MAVARNLVSKLPARALRDLGRRTGLPEFFDWWLGELAQLVPSRVRSALQRRRLRPVLQLVNGSAEVWQPVTRGGEMTMEPIAEIALGGEAATVVANGRAALDRIADGATAPRIVVALTPKQVLRRTLMLPAAIEENLKDAIAYDLDRHTPFKADELYFDVHVVQRDSARSLVKVELAAARRGIVDQAIQLAESWGAIVTAVVPEPPRDVAASRLNLLPEERRGIGAGLRWHLWVPMVLLLALAAFAAVLPVWQKREYAIALLRTVDEARTQATASDRVRTELDRLVGEFNFALQRKFAFPSTLQVLEEITKLLPDDTWLTQMELKTTTRGKETQRELLLRGESGNAGRLITLFEESTVFAQAAPRSPTTKIQPGPGEIFDLAAQLRPLPPPAPVVLASNASSETTKPPAPSPPSGAAPSAPDKAASAAPASGASQTAPAAGGAAGASRTPNAATAQPAQTPAAAPTVAPVGASTATTAPPASGSQAPRAGTVDTPAASSAPSSGAPPPVVSAPALAPPPGSTAAPPPVEAASPSPRASDARKAPKS